MGEGDPDDAFDALDEQLLLDLAGPASFERGVGYHRGGNVVELAVDAVGTLQAKVSGTRSYVARLTIDSGGAVDTACTCPVGEDGLACKHVVAAGLGLLAEQGRLDPRIAGAGAGGKPQRQRSPGDTQRTRVDPEADLERLVSQAPREVLARVIVDRARTDERWRDEVVAKPGAGSAGGPDPAHFKRLLQGAFRVSGHMDWRRVREWARDAEGAIAALDDLAPRAPVEVVRLCEYGLKRCDAIYSRIDDSNGEITMLVCDLETRHARAAAAGGEDAAKLAERLFALLVDTDLGYMRTPLVTHAEALGDDGRRHYRAIALAAFDELRGVDEDARDHDGDRLRSRRSAIRSALEHVARMDRDVDLLVEVIESRVGPAHHAVRVAEACLEIGELDAAIEWAQRAAELGSNHWRWNAHEIHARALLARGLDGDAFAAAEQALAALSISWQSSMLDLLLECADELDERAAWRDHALDAATQLNGRKRFEVLAGLHLHLGEVDDAWTNAQAGACSLDLRLRIADARAAEHPEDSALVYLEQVDEILARGTSTRAYPRVEAALARADALLATPKGRAIFDEKIMDLRDKNRHGRKTSLMARLNRRGW